MLQGHNVEARFDINELFFSRTDLRGVIEYGNEVFCRMSGYELSHMRGKPHNVIRHPDMPKCVFKLFWERLQSKLEVVAYVKNRARDGSFYWVLALVTHVENGYVSVRLKPSSQFFKIVQGLYSELLEIEKTEKISISHEKLFKALAQLGFPNYDAFMQKVLHEEMLSRSSQLKNRVKNRPHFFSRLPKMLISAYGDATGDGNKAVRLTGRVQRFETHFNSVQAAANRVLGFHRTLKVLSLNMACAAQVGGDSGRTLGVVSRKFRDWSEDIQRKFRELEGCLNRFDCTLKESIFSIYCSTLIFEMGEKFFEEIVDFPAADEELAATSHKILKEFYRFVIERFLKVESELQVIFKDYQIIHQILHDLFNVAVGMDVIRVNGRIEAAESNFKYRGFESYIESMEKLTIDLKVTLESLLVQSDSVIEVCQGVGTALIDARNQVFQLTGIASRYHIAVHPQPLATSMTGSKF
jgi:PAS domain S-box-containing protein